MFLESDDENSDTEISRINNDDEPEDSEEEEKKDFQSELTSDL